MKSLTTRQIIAKNNKNPLYTVEWNDFRDKEWLLAEKVRDALARFWSRATKGESNPFRIKLDEAMDMLQEEIFGKELKK